MKNAARQDPLAKTSHPRFCRLSKKPEELSFKIVPKRLPIEFYSSWCRVWGLYNAGYSRGGRDMVNGFLAGVGGYQFCFNLFFLFLFSCINKSGEWLLDHSLWYFELYDYMECKKTKIHEFPAFVDDSMVAGLLSNVLDWVGAMRKKELTRLPPLAPALPSSPMGKLYWQSIKINYHSSSMRLKRRQLNFSPSRLMPRLIEYSVLLRVELRKWRTIWNIERVRNKIWWNERREISRQNLNTPRYLMSNAELENIFLSAIISSVGISVTIISFFLFMSQSSFILMSRCLVFEFEPKKISFHNRSWLKVSFILLQDQSFKFLSLILFQDQGLKSLLVEIL
ncbi:hypothetical protein VP01_171g1 [Puccinia sorghi]|uniref:Uncharacterized protein n=1 Tax=Puccinia sorghi TaxID=27349 RepID=A0A0L6VFG1_9BASI|nr:hypothetical protein VP01_171g1 [Puccinia sorghi]